ncbi:hypothetical protein DPMN_029719 [Dreissena polymorpha]|uniref:Uncharacterized protein n=1 Tax=Dreissena polymorpha TaxID=45954 RepID=A0A9D4M1C7_DREPO|nr:hypothetical protein DPMN_029719 [Dreissena polymorpha]
MGKLEFLYSNMWRRSKNKGSEVGAPGLVMGPCIVEIYYIVIREVQYQFEVNRCRNKKNIVKYNFGWVWPLWAGRPRVVNGAMHKVQYQFEVNRCRNEKIIVKGNFGGCCLCGRGAPGLVMGPCIVEIDRIVIREVKYQLDVNRCRNEDIIVKGNFGWVWSMWAGSPRIDRIKVIVKGNFGWVWSMWAGRPRIYRIVIREGQYLFEVNRCRNEFQGSSADSVGEDSCQDGRTDAPTDRRTDGGDNHNVPTLFEKRGDNKY